MNNNFKLWKDLVFHKEEKIENKNFNNLILNKIESIEKQKQQKKYFTLNVLLGCFICVAIFYLYPYFSNWMQFSKYYFSLIISDNFISVFFITVLCVLRFLYFEDDKNLIL